jgi:hypothetical protein
MRELVLTCAMTVLGAGCVEVIPHRDEFDAGPDITISDVTVEAEVSAGKCLSGRRWTGGNMASPVMTPGQPCMAAQCHGTTAAKTPMTMGGTIYPLGGERDDNDCNGIDGTGVAVVVSDEMNVEIARIQVNAAGNFYTNRMLPPSYKVKVAALGREAVMVASVTNGDCNFCHTAVDYMGAKGRIVPKAP